MSTDELRDILVRLDWTQSILADRAGRSYSRIRRMANGRDMVDEPLADWLRALDRLAQRQPPGTGRMIVHADLLALKPVINRLGWSFDGGVDEAEVPWLMALGVVLDHPPPPLSRTITAHAVAA